LFTEAKINSHSIQAFVMNRLTIIPLLFACSIGFSQSAQKEINEQVWKPFIKSYNDYKADDFLALHSKDVIRSARDSKKVWNWDQYLQSQSEDDKRELLAKSKRTLSLRFTERLNNATQALDVGIFQVVYQLSDGRRESYYGRFHVALRKENGHWKILVDTDSTEDGKIGERDFLAASPMEQ
jgi:ketosteroid isomerase-like protein